MSSCRHQRIRRADAGYPALLGAIHDPPACLWARDGSNLDALAGVCVGVVGARSCSGYGRAVARMLARELAAAGAVVVSGMARGVDGEAHRGALDAAGRTVAVLGCGIDRDYPTAHAELARRIVAGGGAVVSEYEPGVEPAPWRFPARNRIIAGLSSAVVVVEARERSGALITVDFALDGGREVLVVPGEITSALSDGPNALLRLGATPVTCGADVLEAVALTPVREESAIGEVGATVLSALSRGPGGVDELARATGLGAGEVAAALVELELTGLVLAVDGLYRPLAPPDRPGVAVRSRG